MKWKIQFDVEAKLVPVCKADYSTPVEGFIPGQCEPLGVLVRRLTLGQAVPMSRSGVYGEDQIFENQMIDKFDILDRESDLRAQVSRRPERAAEEPKPNETLPQEPTPPA